MSVVIDGSSGITTNSGTVVSTTDATLNGLTVGKGGGSVSTNTAVGYQAGQSNTTGYSVTSVGYQALYTNTAAHNTALGYQALFANAGGSNNTAVGDSAGVAVTSGIRNTVLGSFALQTETTGNYNTAVGFNALNTQNGASNNTAVGYQAGYTNTTGVQNTYMGRYAGYTANSDLNTLIGDGAGYYISSGAKNTILGRYNGNQGGLDIRTASNYIVLSDGDGNPRVIVDSNGYMGVGTIPVTSISNTTGITLAGPLGYYQATRNGLMGAYNRTTSDGDILTFYRQASGVGSISVTASATAYNTSSDYRLKENIAPMAGALARVQALKPVTYKWKVDGSDGEGFIAHELADVVPQCVTGEKDALDEEGNPKYQGIDTSFLVATLTAAIQELKALVDAQATEIAELKAKVA